MAVFVTVVSLLVSGGAKGDVAAHCARLSVQSEARERLVTGHGRRVVVIGDSYSVGLGLRRPQTSWPSRLPGRVQVYGFSGSGFSPRSSACHGVQYAARAPHALAGGASLVVVEGGLNDYDQPESDVRSGFRALMRQLRGHQVLVVGPPPAPARRAAALRIDALMSEESELAGVHYLSMSTRIFPYLDDHLHLTQSGHRAFGSIVADAIAPAQS